MLAQLFMQQAQLQRQQAEQMQYERQAAMQMQQQFMQHMSTLFTQGLTNSQHALQQALLSAPHAAQKKAMPAQFNGKPHENIEVWLFSMEEYYADASPADRTNGKLVTNVALNFGTDVMHWYRDYKMSHEGPIAWDEFRRCLKERFQDADHQFKCLTKLYNLSFSTSQSEYTSKFLSILNSLEMELPELVKRWFYQQNLRAETSLYIATHRPEDLNETIDLALTFEDAQAANKKPGTGGGGAPKAEKKADPKAPGAGKTPLSDVRCHKCQNLGHYSSKCPQSSKTAAAQPKNA